MTVRLPGNMDRLTEIGCTGSGKTVAALWQLSKKDFKEMPWVILDFKREDFNDVRARKIGYEIPEDGGLYIIQPRLDEKKKLENFLWKVWDSRGIGIYIDEAYMVEYMESNEPFIAILTQGRSKHIPMINLAQRPAWISRFVISEAQYIQVFDLTDLRDYETLENFMPKLEGRTLPTYHSWYWDVRQKQLVQFSPVPPKEEIIAAINRKLFRRKI